MRWLASLLLRLERIHENAVHQFNEMVAGSLAVPLLVCHQLCLKPVFNLGQFVILGLCVPNAVVQIQNGRLQLDNLLLRLDILDELQNASRSLRRLMYGDQQPRNFGNGHSVLRANVRSATGTIDR